MPTARIQALISISNDKIAWYWLKLNCSNGNIEQYWIKYYMNWLKCSNRPNEPDLTAFMAYSFLYQISLSPIIRENM